MGKKKGGKSSGAVSKGERKSVSAKTRSLMKSSRSPLERMMNKQDAWRKGLNPWLTIDNPVSNETNRTKIRVRANDYWGRP